jgi:hypothetical protein
LSKAAQRSHRGNLYRAAARITDAIHEYSRCLFAGDWAGIVPENPGFAVEFMRIVFFSFKINQLGFILVVRA